MLSQAGNNRMSGTIFSIRFLGRVLFLLLGNSAQAYENERFVNHLFFLFPFCVFRIAKQTHKFTLLSHLKKDVITGTRKGNKCDKREDVGEKAFPRKKH